MTCDGRQNRSRISNLNGKLWFDYFGTILLPRESTVYAVGGEVVAFGCGCVCVYLWRMCVHFWVLKPLIWLCCRLQDETALRQDAENGLNAFRQVGFTTHNKVKVNYSPVRLYLLKQSRVFFSPLDKETRENITARHVSEKTAKRYLLRPEEGGKVHFTEHWHQRLLPKR